MPKQDDQALATKSDIRMLMDEIGNLYDANEHWKDEILGANERWKKEIIDHFDFVAENMLHDFRGAHKDDMENVQTRITRLEEHADLAAR